MKLILTALFLLGLSACATAPVPETVDTPPVLKAGLSAQTLTPGDCGLFVWTADAKRSFILFSQATARTGLWHSGGKDIPLRISEQSGNPADRQFPHVNYAAADETALSLNLQNREPIIDGTRFKAGTLKIVKPDGWDRVVPVVGLSACQTP